MAEHVDAGGMRDRMEVLGLVQDRDGNWAWSPVRRTWGKVTLSVLKNLFSTVGIGARDASILVRRQELTLHNALRWNGTHLFLSSILPFGRNHLELRAALVTPVECRKDADKTPTGCVFPGVLTEKYVGHEQMDPLAVVTGDYVLVTPKPITLAPGSWVICDGRYYRVLVPHELDEYKNEYEIRRKEDC